MTERAVAANELFVSGERGRESQEKYESTSGLDDFHPHGNTRSILRQSFCAEAHLAVQSGAWFN